MSSTDIYEHIIDSDKKPLRIERVQQWFKRFQETGDKHFDYREYIHIPFRMYKNYDPTCGIYTELTPYESMKYVIESREKYLDKSTTEVLECPICGFKGQELSNHVVRHGITREDFKNTYGPLKSSSICERVTGNKNPAYQHGGKYSPFSSKFVKYVHSVDPESAASEFWRKIHESKPRSSFTFCEEYWTSRGYSEEEAAKIISDRGRTFSLEICIEKYGEDEGFRVWKDRQDRWQRTLNSKSPEEIEEINRKKSTKVNFRSLWSMNLSDDGQFYIIRLPNGFIKVGVTSKSIDQRYSDRNFEVVYTYNSNLQSVFAIEQLTIQKFKSNRISKDERWSEFGWTETIKNINDTEITSYVKSIIGNELQMFNEMFNRNCNE